MPLLGAHMSIAGGYYKALLKAKEYGCDTVQLFTKNNNQWRGKSMTDEDIQLFQQHWRDSGLRIPIAHDCYLINLASPQLPLYRQSVEAFVDEMERAEKLKLAYLVTHPGAATDGDEAAGLRRVARALDEVHRRCRKFNVRVLLETTAGQGSSLGHRFEHLARILDLSKHPDRIGVCLDTCHVFAAGYPLSPQKEYRATFRGFDRIVGLDKLKAFHFNDSQKPLGSRIDRHAHIGQGCLGLEPFRYLVNDRRFRNHAMILETPKEGADGADMDPVNLRVLRSLVKK
ncbi:MAG: deoxyribonuclease IV [Gemmataceae bacterium]|nr:deoxyribonuclease IV [Gemmataceae bacterium]MCI0737784.1 deoxyribonuclease IV [Gemmataceae bacterium]